MPIDFFKTTGELRKYIATFDASANVDQFDPHLRPAREKVINIIGQETYDLLRTYYNDTYPGTDKAKKNGVDYMQEALANFIARSYSIFHAEGPDSKTRKYRYQEEKILEMYLEHAWTGMNNLLKLLETNTTTFSEFEDTDVYKERQTLFIKSAQEFHKGFQINNSAYFYNNVVSIIKEVQLDIKSRHSGFPDSLTELDDETKWIITKAIAFETVARACVRLDYTELPRGIRNDVMKEVNTKSRLNTYQESYIRENLYHYLHDEAEKWLWKLDFEANKDRNDGDYIEPTDDDPISEDDNFYVPGL
jgi:hypothetical protein